MAVFHDSIPRIGQFCWVVVCGGGVLLSGGLTTPYIYVKFTIDNMAFILSHFNAISICEIVL